MPPANAAPMFSPELRRGLGRLLAVVLMLTVGLWIATPASAATNLVPNPGFETLGANGIPSCWERVGFGNNTFTFGPTTDARSGSRAMRIAISQRVDGNHKALMVKNAQCAPKVTVGRQYDLSVWYKSTTSANAMTLYRHDTKLGWQYWIDPATLPASGTWQFKTVRTPLVPPNTDQVTWGVSIYSTGTLTTDDYAMTEVPLPPPTPAGCTDASGCVKGKWQVMPYQSTVRGIHAVVLDNGKVLLVAGSGNDPKQFAAGTFKTAVYDPVTGVFTNVPTPDDLFCAGHVQLSDGKVLVMGGNKAYPTPDGTGYKGLRNSYIFDPAKNTYTRINDMEKGHWYPSATLLGNGDVISLGGQGEDAKGTVVTEYYSAAQQKWLPPNQVKQNYAWWGFYPTMVLMQDGRLFYTGSHTFGKGRAGTGASIYDIGTGSVTDVPGLRKKDERDQSMSVLLPPAQDQKVFTVGGGNGDSGATAHRLTDIIDLKAANPTYQPGPDLPQGTLSGGVPQTGDQGKMYVSLVLLPDGKIFETGGGLHNRADPVYEASIYNPATNTFSGAAIDPVPRTYHSSAFLLPDGRVMAVGDNPANGSFDMRISIYSPAYLFKGARPQISSVANTNWTYGSTQRITVDSTITRASLIRPAAVTHSSDPNQRFVELPMTVKGNEIDLNVTSNPNVAPPGWYMLFVHNGQGVPSVAKWVKLG